MVFNSVRKNVLEGRTKAFSVSIISVIKRLELTPLNRNIVSQLLHSATSVGANYREAQAAVSKSDFRNKIHICRKEIQETKYWLELLNETNPELKVELRKIWKEAHELTLIFSKISGTLKKSLPNK